jgi:hypothetical protein
VVAPPKLNLAPVQVDEIEISFISHESLIENLNVGKKESRCFGTQTVGPGDL